MGEAVPACSGIAFTGDGFTITFDVTADTAFDACAKAIAVTRKCLIDDLSNAQITDISVARASQVSLSMSVNTASE